MSDPTPRSSDDVAADEARDGEVTVDGESRTVEHARGERTDDGEVRSEGSGAEESSPVYEETEDATRVEPDDAGGRDHSTTAQYSTGDDDRRTVDPEPAASESASARESRMPASEETRPSSANDDRAAETAEQPGYEQPTVVAPAYEQPPTQARPIPPMFITPPQPPKKRHNRLFGVGVAAVATIVFAVLWAAINLALLVLTFGSDALAALPRNLASTVYWIPVIVFFVAFALLVVIVDRARWVAYVFGGFAVGIAVYLGLVVGALTASDVDFAGAPSLLDLAARYAVNPHAFAAGILGREVPVWFGAWIAAHGRRVRARNAQAQEAYERELADGPSAYAEDRRPAY